MENPVSVNDENIALVTHHDKYHDDDHNDYDNHDASITSKVYETTITMPSSTNKEATWNLWLGQESKRDMSWHLYRHLKCNRWPRPNTDQFKLKNNSKKRNTNLLFFDSKLAITH